jgi:hypothetical protein
MITNIAQRWRDRRDSYRLRGEAFNPAAFEVAAISSDSIARDFVERHHYSGSYPAARERFGLYLHGFLCGVAVYSVPCHPNVISNWFPFEDWRQGVELGRFVLLDSVPFNAESWFLARTRELLAQAGYLGIVSFADPLPRTNAQGSVTFPGHVGTIYQASNAVLAGRGRSQALMVLPDGTTWHRRNRGKIIGLHYGWQGAVKSLERWGACPLKARSENGRRKWLAASLSKVTRSTQHPGCLRYLWGLNKSVRRHLPDSDPYPKIERKQT